MSAAAELPAWLNIEAFYPPGSLDDIPRMAKEAREILEAVAEFNRLYRDRILAYYERDDLEGDLPPELLQAIDDHTGMAEVDQQLDLAASVLLDTLVGHGPISDEYRRHLDAKYADAVDGVRPLFPKVVAA